MLIGEVEALWDNIRGESNLEKGNQEKCFIEMCSKIDSNRKNMENGRSIFQTTHVEIERFKVIPLLNSHGLANGVKELNSL